MRRRSDGGAAGPSGTARRAAGRSSFPRWRGPGRARPRSTRPRRWRRRPPRRADRARRAGGRAHLRRRRGSRRRARRASRDVGSTTGADAWPGPTSAGRGRPRCLPWVPRPHERPWALCGRGGRAPPGGAVLPPDGPMAGLDPRDRSGPRRSPRPGRCGRRPSPTRAAAVGVAALVGRREGAGPIRPPMPPGSPRRRVGRSLGGGTIPSSPSARPWHPPRAW
jgi:hypothetical protein